MARSTRPHKILRSSRTFFGLIPPDEDILAALEGFCAIRGIRSAAVTANGQLEDARLGSFDARQCVFATRPATGVLEIASLSGNVFPLDGKPFAALWAVLVNEKGELSAGRLFSPARSRSVEFTITELSGNRFHRSLETAMAYHPLVRATERNKETKMGA